MLCIMLDLDWYLIVLPTGLWSHQETEMSERAFALVFLNLGGEMLYVLDQRLYAQKIEVEKGKKSKCHIAG